MKSHDKVKAESIKTKHAGGSTPSDDALRAGKSLHRGAISRATQSAPNEDAIQERIAARAYELYLQRGQVQGHNMDDWLEAERQVVTRLEMPPSPPKLRKSRRK